MFKSLVMSDSDANILKSMLNEDSPLVDKEELMKSANKAGLVLMPITVHTKKGTHQSMRWVKASDVPKDKKSYKNLGEVKEELEKVQTELSQHLNTGDSLSKVKDLFTTEFNASEGKPVDTKLSSLSTVETLLSKVPHTDTTSVKSALGELKTAIESGSGEAEKVDAVTQELKDLLESTAKRREGLLQEKAALEAGF